MKNLKTSKQFNDGATHRLSVIKYAEDSSIERQVCHVIIASNNRET